MANIDAANGDTEYTLAGPNPFVLAVGNHADGSGVWVANLDPSAIITVEWSGAHAGIGRVNLSGQGDSIWIPAGDVTMVTISANVYPSLIGWAYTDPGVHVQTAFAPNLGTPGSSGVTELVNGATTNTAQALTATLAATAGHTVYISGFEVTGTGATAGSTIAVVVSGVVGGPITYYYVVPAGAAVAAPVLAVEYQRALAASAQNVSITVNVPSFGAGNVNAAVVAHGYRQ